MATTINTAITPIEALAKNLLSVLLNPKTKSEDLDSDPLYWTCENYPRDLIDLSPDIDIKGAQISMRRTIVNGSELELLKVTPDPYFDKMGIVGGLLTYGVKMTDGTATVPYPRYCSATEENCSVRSRV